MRSSVQYPELAAAFAAYCETHLEGARDVAVTGMRRVHGGASRETYSVDIGFEGAHGREARGLILRRDPPHSLIDTDRRVEFAALRSMQRVEIPTPDALFLETHSEPLGAPFSVMERVDGGVPLHIFRIHEIEPHRAVIGEQFFTYLGRIARTPVAGSPLAATIEIPAPEDCWRRELDHWETEIRTRGRRPEPVAEAAIRWLRRNPPPPPQRLAIVHGDFRTGNFLHDEQGKIIAILDWEMAHIGDPLEDLAWATDSLWCGGDEDRAAGFLPWPDAIALWEEASGCRFDGDAFEWWSTFAPVKGMGMWVASAQAFAEGRNDDPILAVSSWLTYAAHELALASRLARKYGIEATP